MKEQSGFSIIEVVIGAGLMSLVAMGFSASLKNGTIGQKSLQAQDDARVLTQNMQSLVTNPAACAHTFGGVNPELGASTAAIRDRNNVAKFQVTTPRTRYGNRGVELEDLQVGGSGNDRSGLPRWTSTGAATGIALVRVTWRQTGYKVDGVGAQDLLRFFLVNVTSLNASNQIVACTAEALGSLSQAYGTGAAGYLPLWQTEASLAKSSLFQNGETGNVGVGTAAPAAQVHIRSDGKNLIRLEGSMGGYAQILMRNTSDAAEKYFWMGPGTAAANVLTIGSSDSSGTMNITQAGNIGIGLVSPATKLDVSGPMRASAYYYTSDRRLKTSIETLDGLELARKLRGVRFEWLSGGDRDLGFIAQEVERVAPELVLTDGAGMKSVKYGNVTAILVEAVKAQDRRIEALEKRNEAILKRLENLERR